VLFLRRSQIQIWSAELDLSSSVKLIALEEAESVRDSLEATEALLARATVENEMVTTFGMSEIGQWSLMDSSAQSGDVIMRMMARNSISEKLAEDIDAA